MNGVMLILGVVIPQLLDELGSILSAQIAGHYTQCFLLSLNMLGGLYFKPGGSGTILRPCR